MTAKYKFDNGITVGGGARNLLDAAFPFSLSTNSKPFDASRVDPRGRVIFHRSNV